ncbi:2-C-methyl-D-erythritol 2,4-cyclodiphosphate synthase [Eubacterium plexicaudatum ASF492]|nr:2-C-methyl-D-erythritol 2,4-cyclodiphosphate synthase [Eubacterium plexicaudatum ASF492]
MKLLEHVAALLAKEQYIIENIDVTIVAQQPKLRPYIARMEQNVSETLHIQKNQVNIKATTEEGLGFTGTKQGIAAYAICMLSSMYEGSFAVAASGESCGGCGGCPGKRRGKQQ